MQMTPDLALRLGQRRNRLRHARGLSMRRPAGNIIQEAPLAVWANLRQRALDTAIAEINKKTNLNIALESLGRSAHRRVKTLTFAVKTQGLKDGDASPAQTRRPGSSPAISSKLGAAG